MHNTASYLSFIQTLQNNKSWILKFPVCSLGHNPLQLLSNDIVKHLYDMHYRQAFSQKLLLFLSQINTFCMT